MLFVLLFRSEEHDPELEKIHAQRHLRMRMDLVPGLFHAVAPVNVIEDQDGTGMFFFKRHVEIVQGWLVRVIPVKIHQIDTIQ